MKQYLIFVIIMLFLIGCKDSDSNEKVEKWKAEIIATEKDFNDMAQKKGLADAFYFFAADEGVILRNKKVIKGKHEIAKWYEKDLNPDESLSWKPTFVDVSNSGDIGYTYGNYIFTYKDSLGNKKESKGIFHTVWKKQNNGNWKFVWD